MSIISQPVRMWFVMKEDNDKRHGFFMRTPDGEKLHIHVSPFNLKRMVDNKKKINARAFVNIPESAESVLSAVELIEDLHAAAAKNGCSLSDLDVVFDDTELRITNKNDMVLETIEFDDEDEPNVFVAALKEVG